MAGDGAKWEGLLKWSLAHSDGTRPPRNLSEEDPRWFMEAMQAQTVDVVKRMKEITLVMRTPQDVLGSQGVTAADIEGVSAWLFWNFAQFEEPVGHSFAGCVSQKIRESTLSILFVENVDGEDSVAS